MSYKCFGSESSKLSNVSISSIHTFSNGQCSCSFIFSKDGSTHNKVISDINKEIWDYLLAKGITITAEYLPGARKPISICEQRETQTNRSWIIKFFKQYVGSRSFQAQIFLLQEFLIRSQHTYHGSWIDSAKEGTLFKQLGPM